MGYPRECGGDPLISEGIKKMTQLSPRMRG